MSSLDECLMRIPLTSLMTALDESIEQVLLTPMNCIYTLSKVYMVHIWLKNSLIFLKNNL